MQEPVKLIEIKDIALRHGNIFRLPAVWPYEAMVDFMVVDLSNADRPYGLIVSSGHKAGLILVKLPAESCLSEVRGLSVEWVIDNWDKWIYPECDVKDVYVIDRYEILDSQ
ncbi:Imm45 family immunity protein [Pantoea anthophila]|uniref:Imm45 family immunity protein n=1 Tax=Pantoea anthophila TaxID=470931 RepID=UPI002DB5CAE8|nr:Imm45 family immunity protein [Pantoea anthophila]MEB6222217.1 Imm45 family immunity protein [Pantoea anthophila]